MVTNGNKKFMSNCKMLFMLVREGTTVTASRETRLVRKIKRVVAERKTKFFTTAPLTLSLSSSVFLFM